MDPEEELTLWFKRIEDKPEEAMDRLWQAHYTQLVQYARRRLGCLPRRQVDEEDVASQALASFFRAAAAGRFPDIRDRDDLWKLLLTLTARKANREIRAQKAAKRGGGQVRGESVFLRPSGEGGIELAASPTEEFGDLFAEELLERLTSLGDEKLREIATLKLEGYSNDEISERLSVATRTVERKLQRVRSVWGVEAT